MSSVIELNYIEFGQSENPVIVILHGFFASSRNWRKIATLLADRYHVYALDLRNHGASGHHPNMGYPDMAEDVLAFLDTHRLSRPVLLGHSMGGKVAMWLALQHPERIGGLIVADIAPVCYQHDFNDTIQALLALPLSDIGNRKQAETLLAEAIPDRHLRQFHLQNLVLRQGHYQWRIDLHYFKNNAALITGFPDTQNVEPYRQSILVITGENSRYIFPDHAGDLLKLFPKAEIHKIANTGHWLHVEAPYEFSQIIKDSLLVTTHPVVL